MYLCVYLRDLRLNRRPSLIVIRMTVAPIPIVPLHFVVLPVVLAITPVLCQVAPVGAVLVVVPVMVVAVVRVVDSDADLLSVRLGHNQCWHSNGSSEWGEPLG
jgi:hypothetical protein